jgi:hypothetical protein
MKANCTNTNLAPGDYPAVVLTAEPGVSKKGNDMLVLEFGIGNDDALIKVKHWVVMSHAGSVNEFVNALLPEKKQEWQDSGMTTIEFDEKQLIGLEVDVRTGINEYVRRDGSTGTSPCIDELYACQ